MTSRFATIRRHGFTLVETMIATAVVAIIVVAILMVLPNLNRAVDGEITTNDLQINVNRVMNDVLDRIRTGRILTNTSSASVTMPTGMSFNFACNDTFVKYVVPADHGNGQFVVTEIGDNGAPVMLMSLGAEFPDFKTPMPYRVQKESFIHFGPNDESAIRDMAATPRDNQFYEVVRFKDSGKTISEAEHQIDLDEDGEMNRVFHLGSIVMYYPPALVGGLKYGDVEVPLTGDIILWDPGAAGTRSLPYLFEFGGNMSTSVQLEKKMSDTMLRMNLTAVDFTENGEPFFVKVSSQVSLRNQNLDWADPNRLSGTGN